MRANTYKYISKTLHKPITLYYIYKFTYNLIYIYYIPI